MVLHDYVDSKCSGLGCKVEQSWGQEGISRAHLWFGSWDSCRSSVLSGAFLCLDLYRPGMILPAQYDQGIQMSWIFSDGILSLLWWRYQFASWRPPLCGAIPFKCRHHMVTDILPFLLGLQSMASEKMWCHIAITVTFSHFYEGCKICIWRNVVPYCSHNYILPVLLGLQNIACEDM